MIVEAQKPDAMKRGESGIICSSGINGGGGGRRASNCGSRGRSDSNESDNSDTESDREVVKQ